MTVFEYLGKLQFSCNIHRFILLFETYITDFLPSSAQGDLQT